MTEDLVIDNNTVQTMQHTHRNWTLDPKVTDPVTELKYKRRFSASATKVWPNEHSGDFSKDDCLKFDADNVCNITFLERGTASNLQYYTDDLGDWVDFVPGTTISFGGSLGTLYVFGDQKVGLSVKVKALDNTPFRVSGKLYALCRWMEQPLPEDVSACIIFKGMFEGVQNIVDASDMRLWEDIYWDNQYEAMFKGCTSLVAGPRMIRGYWYTNAYACLREMYMNCSSLTAVTVLALEMCGEEACSSMYENCTSLVDASALNAVAPPYHYTGLAAFKKAFFNCTALETPPERLQSGGEYGYQQCFENCTSLKKFTSPNSANAYVGYRMFANCINADGGSYCSARDWAGKYAFKEAYLNCTSMRECPGFEMCSEGEYAYESACKGCTSLTQLDIAAHSHGNAPAYGLFNNCFNGCTSLNYIRFWQGTNMGTLNIRQSFAGWLSNVSTTGTFRVPSGTGFHKEAGGTFVPLGWEINTY